METYRNCPKCKKELKYSTKYNCAAAEKAGKWCRSCIQSLRTGERNSFFGKRHSGKSLAAMSVAQKQTWIDNPSKTRSLDVLNSGRALRHTMGSNQDIWFRKGGKGLVEEKEKQWKEKSAKASRGENNAMFGKPSPRGSGNGWKGYLDGKFCRSLREALFIADELEGVPFESGELKKYKIQYISPLGQPANYYPDFVTENLIIECKPKRLWKTPLIKAKAKAAWRFAKKLGKRYKLVDKPVNTARVKELINVGRWKFEPRYDSKYKAYIDAIGGDSGCR